jgi:predicted phage terminase large subunit-like protein
MTIELNQGSLAALRRRKLFLTRDRCKSFYGFVQVFWSYAEPRDFIDNWHINTICDFLEKVTRGEIRHALINCPPGVAKSLLVCVLWPAWVWSQRPAWRALFTSHNAGYAARDSIKCRRVIESDLYRELFPDVILARDVNRTDKFENTRGGVREAQGVLGATGSRVNCVVVDDPYTTNEYNSKADRERVHTWWTEAIPSRLDDKKNDALVIVMQRLGSNDLSGIALDKNYSRVSLAAEFDPLMPPDLAPGDPRKEPGEPLFPGLQDRDVLAELRKQDMTEASFQAQYNQKPIDLEGGMFPAKWWRFHKPDGTAAAGAKRPAGCFEGDAVPLPAKFHDVTMSIDCAFKGGDHNDYNVLQIWGRVGANKYLLDQVRRHLDAPGTVAALLALRDKWHKAGFEPRRVLIEDTANGPAIIAQLQGHVSGLCPVRPDGGKEARAASASIDIESGNVFLPEGASYLDSLITEFASFPKGKNDDQVDAMTQYLNYIHGKKLAGDRFRKLSQW